MKKSALLIFLAIVLLFPISISAQFCGFDEDLDSFKINYPKEYYQARASHVAALKHFTRYNPGVNYLPSPVYCENCLQGGGQCPQANYLLPVVVHIIHLPGDTIGQRSNISDVQIEHQLEILNKIYRNDAGLNSINTGIQFCLAQKRPDGTSFNGINRIASDSSNLHRYKQSELTSLIHYPTDHYINIYVVNMMFDNNDDTLNIAGFASYPYRGSRANDLIVIRADWFGDYNVFNHLYNQSRGKTLIHEMGHYLGLYHPFQDGCSGTDSSDCATKGDLCCDVPQEAIQKLGYCGPDNTCTETPNDSADQKENHMDYGLETCRTRFTADQANLLYTTLNGVRSGLWLPSNINNLELACCVNAVAFDGFTDVCHNSGDSIHLTAYAIDSAIYTWYLFKNGAVYDTINSGYNHQISFLPDTGIYDIALEVLRSGTYYNRRINRAIEVLMCDSLLPSTQGSWYFGQYAGIRFYKNGLVLRDNGPANNQKPTQINAGEGTISMCDSAGNLLFYGGTNGGILGTELHIYDADYKEMESSPLKGNGTASQGTIPCKIPGDTGRYYIFHTSDSLYYSIVDMAEVSVTKGGVVSKNILIGNHVIKQEGISLIHSCDSVLWLLAVSGENQDSLVVYKVTGSGIVFQSSFSFQFPPQYQESIKVSPDGQFITIGKSLYAFDKRNGSISFLATDNDDRIEEVIGSSFSPNSSYLYRIEHYYENSHNPPAYFLLTQLDVYAADPVSSKRIVRTIDYHEQIQTGSDNNLYISAINQNYISRIHYPNLRYIADNNIGFEEVGVILNRNGIGGLSNIGLPNFINSIEPEILPVDFDYRIENCNQVELITNAYCTAGYQWLISDTLFSTQLKPALFTFPSKGSYKVSLITGMDTLVKWITIGIDSTYLTLSGPSVVCDTLLPKTYSVPYNADFSYHWSVNNGLIVAEDLNGAEILWKNNGSVKLNITDQRTHCSDSVEMNISIQEPTNISDSIYSDQTACTLSELDTLFGTAYGGVNYLWMQKINNGNWQDLGNSNNAKHLPSNLDTVISYYRIAMNNETCTRYESNVIIISSGDSLVDTLQSNQFLCPTQELDTITGPSYSNAQYRWYIKSAGQSEFQIDTTNTTSFFYIPAVDTTLYFKRIAVIDQGCDYYSNIITVHNSKPINTITPKYPASPLCYNGGNGSDPAMPETTLGYQWMMSKWKGGICACYDPFTNLPTDTFKDLNLGNEDVHYNRILRIVRFEHCTDTSEVVTVYSTGIDLHPKDANICYALGNNTHVFKGRISLTGSFSANILWQNKKGGGSWQYVKDTFYTTSNFGYEYTLDSSSTNDSIKFGWITSSGGCVDTIWSKGARIQSDTAKPSIYTLFTDVNIDEFLSVMYGVGAHNSSNAQFNWEVKASGYNYWTPMHENASTMTIAPVEFCQNGNTYRVIVSNACGSDTSNNSVMSVNQIIFGQWYDIWLIDSHKDTAAEPNTFVDPYNITFDVYRSPDIWNCKDNSSCETHQNAEYKTQSPNYAMVKVRNKGPNETSHDNLRVYWTHCSTGELWDASWLGTDKNRFFNADSNRYFPLGGEITPSTGYEIANLESGDSIIVNIPWYPPNPDWYYSKVNGNRVYEQNICVCLLVRIEQCGYYPYGMTTAEEHGHKIHHNAIENNNIATKNISILNEINGDQVVKSDWTGVGRMQVPCDSIRLSLVPENPDFFDHWNLEFIIDDTIAHFWDISENAGSGFVQTDSNTLFVDGSALFTLKSICLDSGLLAFVKINFISIDSPYQVPEEVNDIALFQESKVDSAWSYQGGVVYRIDNEQGQMNQGPMYKRKPETTQIHLNETLPFDWRIYPNPTAGYATVSITSEKERDLQLQISDVYGKVVESIPTRLKPGQNEITVNTLGFANGTYFITLHGAEGKWVKKLMILKN